MSICAIWVGDGLRRVNFKKIAQNCPSADTRPAISIRNKPITNMSHLCPPLSLTVEVRRRIKFVASIFSHRWLKTFATKVVKNCLHPVQTWGKHCVIRWYRRRHDAAVAGMRQTWLNLSCLSLNGRRFVAVYSEMHVVTSSLLKWPYHGTTMISPQINNLSERLIREFYSTHLQEHIAIINISLYKIFMMLQSINQRQSSSSWHCYILCYIKKIKHLSWSWGCPLSE